MREIREFLGNVSRTVFDIGFEGEQNHTRVIINCAALFRNYPDAVATMVARPPAGDLYPIVLTREGKNIIWDVAPGDVANAGTGQFQLTFTDGDGDEAEIIKTEYGSYSVRESMVATGEAPDPITEWIADANEVLASVESVIEQFNSKQDAPETAGTAGQVLGLDEDLSPKWVTPTDPTDQQVADAVTDWLDDHVSQGETLIVDTSLRVSGAAADSKSVGDSLIPLRKILIKNTSRNLFDKDSMTIINGYMGGTAGSSGTVTENANSKIFAIPCDGNTTYTISRKNAESRFAVGTAEALHTSGSFSLIDYTSYTATGNSTKELHITTSASAAYLYVWYYRSASDSDYASTLEEMMVEYGSSASPYEPYGGVVEVRKTGLGQDVTDDLQKGVDAYDLFNDPIDRPNTYNLLDVANATIIDAYITGSGSTATLKSSVSGKTLIAPIKPGRVYTVTRKNEGSRFAMAYGTAKWTDSSDHTLTNYCSSSDPGNSLKRLTSKAPAGANYLYIFFYRSASDSSYDPTIEEMMMVLGSEVKPYIAYSEEETYLVDDLGKGTDAYNQVFAEDRWESRKRIFGVEFSNEVSDPGCDRIGDATPQTNFSKEFPWCEMRRCAVTITNGKKTIIYEGETGFAVDGSAGNVMVEIPAFYVCRERFGSIERWMISGTHYGGFELHPWFINADGSTVEHRYIGAYIASDSGGGLFSVSGVMPWNGAGSTVNYLADKMRTAGYQRHNIYAMSAIQYLFIVEYATRDAGSIFNGSDYNVYMMTGNAYDWMLVQSIDNNTMKLGIGHMSSGNSFLFYSTGMQVSIGASYDSYIVRTITAISHDEDYMYITVDGDPITLTEGLRCGGISQKSGKTDSLTTPSGYAPGMDSHVACFRYRGIENIWGNLWEMLDGIKIRNGVYYVTHDFTETDLTKWETMSYAAPMVTAPDHVSYNWIKSMGYDVDNRTMILPEVLITDNGRSVTIKTDGGDTVAENVTLRGEKYFGNPFASGESTTTTYFPSIGGGWDHHENCGLFTFRFMTSTGGLYGERLTC